jgi:hypothetical protein
VNFVLAGISLPKPQRESPELRLVGIGILAAGIELTQPQSADFRRSSLQQLTRIGEVAVSSVHNWRLRASEKFHGEPAHLWSPLLHRLDHRSSLAPETTARRHSRCSPELSPVTLL